MNLESIITNAQKRISKLALASKTTLLGLGMLGLSAVGFSQTNGPFLSERDKFLALDSLSRIHQIDSLNAVAWSLSQSNPSLALQQLHENAVNSDYVGYLKGEADALVRSGSIHYNRGNYSLALKDHLSSLKLYKKLNSSNKNSSLNFSLFIADAYTNAGIAYDGLGKLDSTFKFYQLASKIYSKSDDFSGIFMINNNLAKLLQQQGDYSRANDYYKSNYSLVFKKLKLDSLNRSLLRDYSLTLNNIGSIFEFNNDLDSASVYYSNAIKFSNKIDDILIKSSYLGNLARIKSMQGNYNSALSILNSAIDLDVSLNNTQGMVSHLQELSGVYMGLGDLNKSVLYLDSSLTLANRLNSPSVLLDLYRHISSSFEFVGKLSKNSPEKSAIYFEKALEFKKKQDVLKDSLFSQANISQLNSLEVQYRTELSEQENALLKKESSLQEAKLTNQRWKYYGALGGIGLLLFSSFFVVRAYRKQKKFSLDLSKSKNELELSNNLLNEQKTKLVLEKEITDKLNFDLTSSINYASRIQKSILPMTSKLSSNVYSLDSFFEDSFIFYKPRDVVSGDFYFAKELDDVLYFSASDSTGHGVPGALMTILSSTLIKESIFSKHIFSPAEILNDVRKGIISNLNSLDYEGISLSDGFDGVLCAYNKKTNYLTFSAANSPVYLKRGDQLKIYAPDKMPVGNYLRSDSFTSKSIQLQKGDILYLASDGFKDQFGGEKNRRYNSRNFKKLISSFDDSISMADVGLAFETEFDSWKGKTEQLDDVLVMGIKF